MCRPVKEANLVRPKVRTSDGELEISRVGIKETVTAHKELDHVTASCTCHGSSRLVPAEHDLVLDGLGFDVGIV